jgi:hypothetical protein
MQEKNYGDEAGEFVRVRMELALEEAGVVVVPVVKELCMKRASSSGVPV